MAEEEQHGHDREGGDVHDRVAEDHRRHPAGGDFQHVADRHGRLLRRSVLVVDPVRIRADALGRALDGAILDPDDIEAEAHPLHPERARLIPIKDKEHAGVLAELGEQVEEAHPLGRVEPRRRLVDDDQLGISEEGHGDAEPLAHAARERAQLLAPHVPQVRLPEERLDEGDRVLYQADAGLVDARKANAAHIALARAVFPKGTLGSQLDTLARHDVKATFFIIDRHLTRDTAPIVARAFEEGHAVALHSHTRTLMFYNPALLASTLQEAAAHLEVMTGVPSSIASSAGRPKPS